MKTSNRKLYIICAIFTIGAIFMLITSEGREEILGSVFALAFFGVGGICYYFLDKKGNKRVEYNGEKTFVDKRSKSVVLLIGSSMFVFACYLFLPFHHIFDDNLRYSPTLGWIIGVAGILFFGAGIVVAIKRLIKPRIIMQISDKGLLVIDGLKPIFIEWKDVQGVSKNDMIFFVQYQRPKNKQPRMARIALSSLNHYNIEQIEDLIMEKIKNNTSVDVALKS
jgi:hypothetical protein